MAKGFDSPKMTLEICDGFEYMRNHASEFDVIITDSSDPVGPATNLFTEGYFQLLKEALKPHGVICSQAGTPWIDLGHVEKTMRHCRRHFASVGYALVNVPTYPSGQIGFVVASRDAGVDLATPTKKFNDREVEEMKLRYYSSDVHGAAFVLPNFIKKKLL